MKTLQSDQLGTERPMHRQSWSNMFQKHARMNDSRFSMASETGIPSQVGSPRNIQELRAKYDALKQEIRDNSAKEIHRKRDI